MRVKAQPVKRTRISGAFFETARQALSKVGSPTQVAELVELVLKTRPLQRTPELLGQELYKAAKTGEAGFVVEDYPRFKLKKLEPRTPAPSRGYVAAAFRVLTSPSCPHQYVDVREIVQKALEAGMLQTVSPVPEYWMSVQLDSSPGVFSRSGQLTLALNDWRQPTIVSVAAPKRSPPEGRPSSITEGIYERDIESLIAERLDVLESGLQLLGRQYSTPVGRIDILCKDRRGDLVVVELKSFGAKTSEIVDQIARYMGYVRTHIALPRQVVRGVIVVGQVDENLGYAILPIPNLEIRTFEVTIKNPPSLGSSDHK